MFSRTLKAHKLKINTQMRQQASRKLRVAEFHGIFEGVLAETRPWPWLPHHSYAMKTFIWQKPFSAGIVVVDASFWRHQKRLVKSGVWPRGILSIAMVGIKAWVKPQGQYHINFKCL